MFFVLDGLSLGSGGKGLLPVVLDGLSLGSGGKGLLPVVLDGLSLGSGGKGLLPGRFCISSLDNCIEEFVPIMM